LPPDTAASTASHPNVRDDRDTPLVPGWTARLLKLIWGRGKQEYFLKRDWTGQITLNRFSNSSRRMFDERGRGLILRGARAQTETKGRHPYLTAVDAEDLVLLAPHENSDSALPRLAEEVLALTKVNWNTTQFDQKFPAPIKATREVGRILKHIEYGTPTSPDFRKYT
jgi:hypothetical protein